MSCVVYNILLKGSYSSQMINLNSQMEWHENMNCIDNIIPIPIFEPTCT